MELYDVSAVKDISIHAPREGSDLLDCQNHGQASISIHAPREGSDTKRAAKLYITENFNPRSP